MEKINTNVLLKVGSRGEDVKKLQKVLKRLGHYEGFIDGIFGPMCAEAVKDYQQNNNLFVDGIVGSKTIAFLNNVLTGYYSELHLTDDDLITASNTLGCELAVIKAVDRVESNGNGFNLDGTLKILYERHIMLRRLKDYGLDTLATLASTHMPELVNSKPGGYSSNQKKEYDKLNEAAGLNKVAAYDSVSMGRYQIMGFHAQHLGFKDSLDMFAIFNTHERKQLETFVNFIKQDNVLHRAMISKDWVTFARIYNGPNYAKHGYDLKLHEAYLKYQD